MSPIGRRDLLLALAALGTGALAAAPASAAGAAVLGQIDVEGAAEVGRAYLAAHPQATAARLTARLLPSGPGPAALAGLRAKAREDFRRGRVFVHRGWRLSDTEGALMALLAAT